MAIRLVEEYPNRVGAPTAEYPHGVPRNKSTPTATDGTPFEQSWFRDQEGFFQGLLETAGITPSGSSDTVEQSDYLDALTQIANGVTDIDVGGAADVTISVYQGRISALRLTGTLSGDIDLIVPDVSRLYWIVDDTAGDFSVTAKTELGTGVVLSSGMSVLRCDGADVFRADTVTTATGEQTVSGALDQRVIYVDTIADLQAMPTGGLVDGQSSRISQSERKGVFRWAAGDFSGAVSSDPQMGLHVPPASDLTGSSGAWLREYTLPAASMFGLSSGGDLSGAIGEAVSNGLFSVILVDVDCIVTSVMETSQPIIVKFLPGVTIDVQTNNGVFNVNSSPFLFHGERTEVTHSSRVLFFGNDPLKTFDGIEIRGFVFNKVSSNQRTTLYFPNTITKNVSIKDIMAYDTDTPSGAEFIQVDWGSNSGTSDWLLEGITSYRYSILFRSQGNAFSNRLKAINIRSIDSSGEAWSNYHFRQASLDIYLERNQNPAYIWAGDSININLKSLESVNSSFRIEQLQSNATVFTEEPGGYGTVLEWGSNHCILNISNQGGPGAVEINPGSNTVTTSTIDGVVLNVVSREHLGAAVKFDQNGNPNHPIKGVQVNLSSTSAPGATAGIIGRNLKESFDLHVVGGVIDPTHTYAIDLRAETPSSDNFRAVVTGGCQLSSDGGSLIRSDKNGGLFLVSACVLDDYSKLSTSWTSGSGNYVSNCWDEATNSNVSS